MTRHEEAVEVARKVFDDAMLAQTEVRAALTDAAREFGNAVNARCTEPGCSLCPQAKEKP